MEVLPLLGVLGLSEQRHPMGGNRERGSPLESRLVRTDVPVGNRDPELQFSPANQKGARFSDPRVEQSVVGARGFEPPAF